MVHHLHLVKIVDIIKCIIYLKTAALSVHEKGNQSESEHDDLKNYCGAIFMVKYFIERRKIAVEVVAAIVLSNFVSKLRFREMLHHHSMPPSKSLKDDGDQWHPLNQGQDIDW